MTVAGTPSPASTLSRPGVGKCGHHVSLLVNHLKVSIEAQDVMFCQYNVKISSGDGMPTKNQRVCREVIDKLRQTYPVEFSSINIVYDGDQILYTVGALPGSTFEFTVVLEKSFAKSDEVMETTKRTKLSSRTKVYKVELSYSRKVPLLSMNWIRRRGNSGCFTNFEHHSMGCLLIRQSFFSDDSRNCVDVGGGVHSARGLHSSFHATQAGLSLNMDVAMTLVIKPGPVLDFLRDNQNVQDECDIDWEQAKRMLKNLRIKTNHTNMEFKITGLSEKPCNQLRFFLKRKDDDVSKEEQTLETTVPDYFIEHHRIELSASRYFPCLDVGKPDNPVYLPLEVCSLVSLQRYKMALSSLQKASMIEKSKQKSQERFKVLTDAVRNCPLDESLLAAYGISIEKKFMQVDSRILEAPKLKMGKGEDCIAQNGRWTFKNRHLLAPIKIEHWAIVNFSSRCDTSHLSRELINCARRKGMHIERPYALVEEDPRLRKASPVVRVDEMFEKLVHKLPDEPQFILCVLPERKICDLYGPWKLRSLTKFAVVTQCVAPVKITEQYLSNVLLKINAKLGGTNSLLAIEEASCIPHIKDVPTLILGMDVSHGPAGQSDVPSVAAVVGSLYWPSISKYRAAVRTQVSRVEMIDSLFKLLPDGKDDGIMRELLVDFYVTSNSQKPKQIIIFRDGVSESQFSQVLNIELEQIKQAYQNFGEDELPKFTVIVAQKRHYTKFFQANTFENAPPGTVVDTGIVHQQNYDFYLYAHGGTTGALRPAHYHVLLDEIGFSPDELQNFVYSLSYVGQRSNCAVSVVAPIYYAHLAAKQLSQFLKVEGMSEGSSEEAEGIIEAESLSIPQLPKLHLKVSRSIC
ncbi:hypothetical protein V2J09_019867 [Rumex salicifolius]